MDAAMPGAEFVPGLSLELGSSRYRNLSVCIIGSISSDMPMTLASSPSSEGLALAVCGGFR